MVSVLAIMFSLLLLVALGAGWMAGYRYFKAEDHQMLVRFYMAYAAFRVFIILGYAAIYIFFISDSVAESKAFVLMLFSMYVLMMALTLILKH